MFQANYKLNAAVLVSFFDADFGQVFFPRYLLRVILFKRLSILEGLYGTAPSW